MDMLHEGHQGVVKCRARAQCPRGGHVLLPPVYVGLLVVDYCSSYVEVAKLEMTTISDVILHLRSVFARHGIPEDNGPQYSAFEFAKFAAEKGFTHITSSHRYPQSNWTAERAVQTVKTLLKKATQP